MGAAWASRRLVDRLAKKGNLAVALLSLVEDGTVEVYDLEGELHFRQMPAS